MSVQGFTLYTATINGASPIVFNQLDGQDLGPNVQLQRVVPAGAVDPAMNVILRGDPKVMFKTKDLTKALGISATVGLPCPTGAVFRLQEGANAGVFSAGSAHVTVTSALGFCCLQSLGAQQDQFAEAALAYMALQDGDTIPLIAAVGVSFSGVTAPAINSLYKLGPVKVGSALFDGLSGFNLDFGIKVAPKIYNGRTYPGTCRIEERMPRLVLQSANANGLGTIGSMFGASPGATVTQYLRKCASSDAGYLADDQTQHIAIVISAGTWKPENVSAQGGQDAGLSIPLDPTGTISISTGVAITYS